MPDSEIPIKGALLGHPPKYLVMIQQKVNVFASCWMSRKHTGVLSERETKGQLYSPKLESAAPHCGVVPLS